MALKDWKKTGKYYFRNKKNNQLLQIGVVDAYFVVMIQNEKEKMYKVPKSTEYFRIEDAMKIAKQYMRSH